MRRMNSMFDGHHGASVRTPRMYLSMVICTASSFLFNRMAEGGMISHFSSFVLILGVAIIKAVLVGLIFMHLKWDWGYVYFIIVPIFILGMMMAIVFLPDGVIGPSRDGAEEILIAAEQQR